MQLIKSFRKFLILPVLVFYTVSYSQNINSPYSVYGIGDIEYKSYGRTSGMAGSGIGLSSPNYLINSNPASIAGLDQSFFVFDLYGTGKISSYSGSTITAGNNSNKDFWIKGLTMASKLNKFWAVNAGMGQFSNVGYKFSGTRTTEGTTSQYATIYEGDGGLNEYYLTNAFSIGKHFSVGVKASIIAGSINQTESLYDVSSATQVSTKQQDYFGNARYQYGALYNTPLNKRWNLSLGARYSSKTNLSADRTVTITENDLSVVTDKFIKTNRFVLPQSFGAGIALSHDKKTTFTADYVHEDWSPLNIKGTGWQYVNSDRVSAGVEFSKLENLYGHSYEKGFYSLGAFANNSYLQVNGVPIREFGFSAGTGGRVGGNLFYSMSAEYGIRGTTNSNLIRENYFQLSFSFSYKDFIFSKGRKYQ
jgi:hypothetical protein